MVQLGIIADQGENSYLNPAVEQDRSHQASGALWRAIRGRGGKRGYKQKVRHLAEGIVAGHYSNSYPFVQASGYEYARSWGFSVIDSVLQGASVWEVSSESSVEEIVTGPPAAKARPSPALPKAKAVIPKAKGSPIDFSRRGSASSSSGAGATRADERESSRAPRALTPVETSEVRYLRPVEKLPDTVLWFDRNFNDRRIQPHEVLFRESSNYRSYRGYKTYSSTVGGIQTPKFVLFVDWHQVLDRSATEGTWNNTFPRDSIEFLQRVKEAARQHWGTSEALLICVLTFIECSSRNLDNVVNTCNRAEIREGGLIKAIFVTRHPTGPLGKSAVIKSFTLGHRIPCAIVDDKHTIIEEVAQTRCHTCHVKIRRKPWSEDAECVKNFLIEFVEPLERLFALY